MPRFVTEGLSFGTFDPNVLPGQRWPEIAEVATMATYAALRPYGYDYQEAEQFSGTADYERFVEQKKDPSIATGRTLNDGSMVADPIITVAINDKDRIVAFC